MIKMTGEQVIRKILAYSREKLGNKHKLTKQINTILEHPFIFRKFIKNAKEENLPEVYKLIDEEAEKIK